MRLCPCEYFTALGPAGQDVHTEVDGVKEAASSRRLSRVLLMVPFTPKHQLSFPVAASRLLTNGGHILWFRMGNMSGMTDYGYRSIYSAACSCRITHGKKERLISASCFWFLPVILGLQKVKLLLDPVAGLVDSELQRLSRLVGDLNPSRAPNTRREEELSHRGS